MRIQLRFQDLETQELSSVIEEAEIGDGPLEILDWQNGAMVRHPVPTNCEAIVAKEGSELFLTE